MIGNSIRINDAIRGYSGRETNFKVPYNIIDSPYTVVLEYQSL